MLPHGGKLIDRRVSLQKRQKILKNIGEFKTLVPDMEQVKDVKNIARGVYSPLKGFLKREDFRRVVSEMRLFDGTIWPIPVVLDVSGQDCYRLRKEKDVLLVDRLQKPIALLEDIQIYSYNKDFFAKNVFGTTDRKHAGVEDVYNMK